MQSLPSSFSRKMWTGGGGRRLFWFALGFIFWRIEEVNWKVERSPRVLQLGPFEFPANHFFVYTAVAFSDSLPGLGLAICGKRLSRNTDGFSGNLHRVGQLLERENLDCHCCAGRCRGAGRRQVGTIRFPFHGLFILRKFPAQDAIRRRGHNERVGGRNVHFGGLPLSDQTGSS